MNLSFAFHRFVSLLVMICFASFMFSCGNSDKAVIPHSQVKNTNNNNFVDPTLEIPSETKDNDDDQTHSPVNGNPKSNDNTSSQNDAGNQTEVPVTSNDNDTQNQPHQDDSDDTPAVNCPNSINECDNQEPSLSLISPDNGKEYPNDTSVISLKAHADYHTCSDTRKREIWIKSDKETNFRLHCFYDADTQDKDFACAYVQLQPDTSYSWYAKVMNECYEKVSETRTFMLTSNTCPRNTQTCINDEPIVTLQSPTNNTTLPMGVTQQELSVQVSYKTCNSARSREVWVKKATEASFTKLCEEPNDIEDTTFSCFYLNLSPNTPYQWYAFAKNECFETTSDVYNFTTGGGCPNSLGACVNAAPELTLQTPNDNTTLDPGTTVINNVGAAVKFNTCSGKRNREIWWKRDIDSQFSRLCWYDKDTGDLSYTCIWSNLQPQTTYKWYARAENECFVTISPTYTIIVP